MADFYGWIKFYYSTKKKQYQSSVTYLILNSLSFVRCLTLVLPFSWFTRFTSLAFCCSHCFQPSSSLTLFACCELYLDHPPLVLLGCCLRLVIVQVNPRVFHQKCKHLVFPYLACSKRSDSGERWEGGEVKKAMKSRGGLGREVRVFPLPPLPLLRFYFFALLFTSHRSPLSERLEQAIPYQDLHPDWLPFHILLPPLGS